MSAKLCTLAGLAEALQHLNVPMGWLAAGAEAGRLPCLAVGRRRLFNQAAVEAALARRAAEMPTAGPAPCAAAAPSAAE